MKNYDDFTWDNSMYHVCFDLFCRANNLSIEEATNYIVNDYFKNYVKLFKVGYKIKPDIFKLPFDEESVKEYIEYSPLNANDYDDLIEGMLANNEHTPEILKRVEELKILKESTATSP